MALAPEQQKQYDSLRSAGADEASAMRAASLVPTSGGSSSASRPSQSTRNDDFINTLQKKLLGQAGAISSEDTKIEETIQKAISGVREGAESGAQAVTSQYNRAIEVAAKQGADTMTGARESQRGFATNTALLSNIQETTDRNLKDLEQRKQELILQGNAAAANQIAGLQLQELEFRQRSQQQAFSNLLGVANFALSANSQRVQEDQFNRRMQFDENSAMSQIALQYGLSVNPGESLTSLYSRATRDMGANSPAALAIKEAMSTINRNNAEIARINKEGVTSNADVESLAAAIAARPDAAGVLLEGVKDNNQRSKILLRSEEIKFKDMVTQDKADNVSKSDSSASILNSDLTSSQKSIALQQLEEVYGDDSSQPITVNQFDTDPYRTTGALQDVMGFLFGSSSLPRGSNLPGYSN